MTVVSGPNFEYLKSKRIPISLFEIWIVTNNKYYARYDVQEIMKFLFAFDGKQPF